ncbi:MULTISPECIES: gentisate 1,2-dioxygenase [unclassified Burkholderia]|uniref:gentisate 1,2-dioxygenase n=1 Tax=unclassified Burkholderia TaxID=2613784 RepID=UPI002AB19122|nr:MULTISPECIES: gentisate 1,2-dioxygenase [unclassified Burkholderia]
MKVCESNKNRVTRNREELEAYYRELDKDNLGPLWEVLKGLVPREPKPKAVPYAWSYEKIRQKLITASELISAEDAERRVLVLQNPGLPGTSQITDTLYAGLQILLPGEVAPAHRHTQAALRFVIEGGGAYTSVNGERTMMHPGDFIITPAWTWHDHGSSADGPVVWMDSLDLPLVRFLGAGFREEHVENEQLISKPIGDSDARYGSGLLPVDCGKHHTSPIFNYPYSRTREALYRLTHAGEPDPCHGYALKYVNPTNGDWAIPTIATGIRLVPKEYRTKPYRSVDGSVLVLVEGKLKVGVGDEIFILNKNDVFAIPSWTFRQFEAIEDSIFFICSDRPVYEKLGLLREERRA